MASLVSNKIQVSKALFGLSQTFSLRRRLAGGQYRLGDKLVDTAAVAIEARTVGRQQDPDGNPLAPLKPSTLRRKAAGGFDLRILIETHEMLDLEQIRGQVALTENSAVMIEGLDAETKQKAEWAAEGAPNRRPRPHYELGKDGEKAVDVLFVETIDHSVRDAENC